MNITNPKLSDRLRPDVEAAPWVIAEIEKLEQQLDTSKEELSRARLQNAIVYGTSHPEIYKTKEDELREQLGAANTLINKYREETTSLRQQLAETEDFCKGEMTRSAERNAKLRQQRDGFKRDWVREVELHGKTASAAESLRQHVTLLLAVIKKFLSDNDPEGFGCACSPNHICGPCSEAKRQRPLYEALEAAKEN